MSIQGLILVPEPYYNEPSYEQYRNSPQVTRQRLYLETMEEVLSKNSKIIIDRGTGGPGVVPYLPLPELNKKRTTSPEGGAK